MKGIFLKLQSYVKSQKRVFRCDSISSIIASLSVTPKSKANQENHQKHGSHVGSHAGSPVGSHIASNSKQLQVIASNV